MRFKIKIFGNATPGRSHLARNQPCQDKVHYCCFEKQSAIISLADGAGSCVWSDIGAEYIVNNIGEIIHSNFDDYFENPTQASYDIVSKLLMGLQQIAILKTIDLHELSSTLLFAYVRKTPKGVKYLAGHIGDGVIAIGGSSDEIEVLSHPTRGDFANTTVFITGPDAAKNLRVYSGFVQYNIGFLLMSDGAAESLYSQRLKTLAPACKEILAFFDRYSQKIAGSAIKKILERHFIKKTHDDCSLSVLKVKGINNKTNKIKKCGVR